jgi:beta propeller repeat protein
MVSASQETRLDIQSTLLLYQPSIYGNYVSWSDNSVNGCHIYDLTTGEEKTISSEYTSCTAGIYGNNAVFYQELYQNGVYANELALYNISTGKLTGLVPCYNLSYNYGPSIYENIIAYNNNSNVYTYDISTKKVTQITTSGTAREPVIYGNSIVYQDNSNICIYNLNTKQISLIGSGSYQNIYGNVVVWANNGNIYMRDIATQKTTQITTNGISENPAIYGDKIVWNTKTYSGNVYMYSISTGKTSQITKSNCACYPAINGNKVVYIDHRNRNKVNVDGEDLFVYDLTAKIAKPVGTITSDVVSGTHPVTVFFGYREDGDIPTSYLWDFGDGITSTHAWTATHTYTKKGTYTVSLKLSNSAGSSTITKTKYITVK